MGGHFVLLGVCLTVTILQLDCLGRGMCPTECHSSLCYMILNIDNNNIDVPSAERID